MAGVYSHRFIVKHQESDVSYPVPLGLTAIIMTVTAFVAAGTPEDYQIVIDPTGATVIMGTLWSLTEPITAGTVQYTNLRVVVHGGESIRASSGFYVDMTVSGYLLPAPQG